MYVESKERPGIALEMQCTSTASFLKPRTSLKTVMWQIATISGQIRDVMGDS